MRKNVVFFHPSSELYGSDKILMYILNNFTDYNKTLVLKNQGILVNKIQELNIDIDIKIIPSFPIIAKKNLKLKGFFCFVKDFILFYFIINKLKKQLLPDIVYLNTLATLPIIFYFTSKKNKIITHVHEILENNYTFHKIINYIAIKKSSLVICVSNAVKFNICNSDKNTKNVVVVNNGINLNYHNKIEITDNFFENRKFRFALIGRIKPSHKGQGLLLDALCLINKNLINNLEFYFIGSTVSGQEYMLKDLKNKVNSNNLDKYIKFIPFVTNIEDFYDKIDVVIVPSIFQDPFPTTVIEAMCFAKPVIATRVGGIPEMVLNNITGILVDNGDAFSLAIAIEKMVINREKTLLMGYEARKRYEKYYTEQIFNKNFKRVIEKLK